MMQNSVNGGKRNDAVTTYLRPAANGTNLDILINTHVTKVRPSVTNQNTGEVLFSIVEMAQGPTGGLLPSEIYPQKPDVFTL